MSSLTDGSVAPQGALPHSATLWHFLCQLPSTPDPHPLRENTATFTEPALTGITAPSRLPDSAAHKFSTKKASSLPPRRV